VLKSWPYPRALKSRILQPVGCRMQVDDHTLLSTAAFEGLPDARYAATVMLGLTNVEPIGDATKGLRDGHLIHLPAKAPRRLDAGAKGAAGPRTSGRGSYSKSAPIRPPRGIDHGEYAAQRSDGRTWRDADQSDRWVWGHVREFSLGGQEAASILACRARKQKKKDPPEPPPPPPPPRARLMLDTISMGTLPQGHTTAAATHLPKGPVPRRADNSPEDFPRSS